MNAEVLQTRLVPMEPKPQAPRFEQDLFRIGLLNLIDHGHELVRLAELVDWGAFEHHWGPEFASTMDRPALATRLAASLMYLEHTIALSDEGVVERWIESPYGQHFGGEHHFRHDLPCAPSSRVRWRKRNGEQGCKWLLKQNICAATRAGVLKLGSLQTVVVDTTVQPKAIAHPTDSRLLNRACQKLVAVAKVEGIELRQSYARVRKAAEAQARRYTHALQLRRARRESKRLRMSLGRVIRDVRRKSADMRQEVLDKLYAAQRLYEQHPDSNNKLYAPHAPEVECIAKGKARTPYEFGVKVAVAVTAKEGVVVGTRSMPDMLCDGHTLYSQPEQMEILTGERRSLVMANRGWKAAQIQPGSRLLLSRGRGLSPRLKKLLRRRQAIEPTMGHMKNDGLLVRNRLKGEIGDAMHALLCGAGHNRRLILATVRAFFACVLMFFGTALRRTAVTDCRGAAARD